MDLTEAEAVMDIIGAKSEDAAKAALLPATEPFQRSFPQSRKKFFRFRRGFRPGPISRGGHPRGGKRGPAFENFPCKGRLQKLVDTFDRGQIVKSGVDTVIAGRTNAGKSTLMNLLCGRESSIVTEIEGTTRDVITEEVALGDIILKIPTRRG